MKRTHDDMKSTDGNDTEVPKSLVKSYLDPISHEPVKDAIVLPSCGHTFDRSSIDRLPTCIADGTCSYTCPLCRRISQGLQRNYAVNEMMGSVGDYSPLTANSPNNTADFDQLQAEIGLHAKRFDTEIKTALLIQESKRTRHILECDAYVHAALLEHISDVHGGSFYSLEEPTVIRKALIIKAQSIECFSTYSKFMIWLTIPYNGLAYSKRLSNIQVELDAKLTDSAYKEIDPFDYHQWRKKWSEIYIKLGYITFQERAALASLYPSHSDEESSSQSESDNSNIFGSH